MSSKWVYAVGKASVITDKAKITELWTEGVRPWFPDGTNDTDVSLLCIKPEKGMHGGKEEERGGTRECIGYRGARSELTRVGILILLYRRVLGSIFACQ
jgi:hypothetical protein